MSTSHRTRALLIAMLAVTAIVVYFSRRGGAAIERRAHDDRTEPWQERPLPAPSRRQTSSPRSSSLEIPREPNPDDPNLPIVDDVSVEKSEVCLGEENFVNVKAHTGNGTDAFLTTRIKDPGTGRFVLGGARIPFRIDEPRGLPITVIVEGNMVSKVVELPPVHIKDCVAPRQVTVHVKRSMAALDRVEFAAELSERSPEPGSAALEPLVPTSYEWDFGDGEKQTTTSAEVMHSYEGRDQSVRQSSFVVTATLKDRGGQSVQGSAVVALPNGAFAPLRFKNEVVISIGVKEADASGEHEKIWLYHGYKEPVRLDSVTLIEKVRDEQGEMRETLRRSYAPRELLGVSDLPPRRSTTIRDLTALQPTVPGAVRFVELHGQSLDGKRASGSFTLLPAVKSVEVASLAPRVP